MNNRWIDSVKCVKDEVLIHFSNHFKALRHPHIYLPEDLFTNRSDARDNEFLCTSFTEKEVKKVAWSCERAPVQIVFPLPSSSIIGRALKLR